MASQANRIFSRFFISSDPGVLKWLLIIGGIGFLGLGLTVNMLYPNYICPKEIYFPLGMLSIWLGGLEGVIKHIRKYLFEYAFWIYVAIYLFVVFVAYSNDLQIGFTLVLFAIHIIFSVSFRSMTEYTVFAIASLLFFSVCTFFRPNLHIHPILFLSVICGISLVAGIYVWMREYRYQDLMTGGELLAGMLDNSDYSIFLLDLKKRSLLYTNQMARQMLLHLSGKTELPIEDLLDFFGLDADFLQKRYEGSSHIGMDLSYYSIAANPGKPLELELRIGKMTPAKDSPFLIKARDITHSKEQQRNLEKSEALNDSLMLAFPDTLLVIDGGGFVKSIKSDQNFGSQLDISRFEGAAFETLASQIMTTNKQEEAQNLLQKTQETREVCQLEFLSAFDKQSLYFDLRFTPLSRQGEVLAIIRNITDERETALNLELSERNYREIFDSVGEGILVLHPENLQLIDLNNEASNMLGYNKEEKENISVLGLSKDPAPEDFERFLKAVMHGVQTRLECAFSRKDGSDLMIEISGKLVILGGEFRLLVSMRDIEERNVFLQEIRTQALLVNKVSEAIISTSESFQIMSWNAAAESIYGWKAQEVLNKPLFEVLSTQVVGGSQESARKVLYEKGSWRGELRQKDKSGKTLSIRSSFTMIPSVKEGTPQIVMLNQDISSERDRMADLRKSEEKFRDLFNSSPDAILVQTLEGKILDANRSACELFKRKREDLLGEKLTQLTPVKQQEMIEGVYAAMTMDQLTFSESSILTSEGEDIPVEIRASSIELEGKKAMILHISDVSQRVVSEERLGLFNRLINQSGDAIFLLDARTGEMVDANGQTYQILQYDSKLSQKSPEEGGKVLLYDSIPKEAMEEVQRTGSAIYTSHFPAREGNSIPVEVNLGYFKSPPNAYLVGVARDITERIYQQNAIRQSEQKYRTLVEKMNEGLLMTDNDETILFVNSRLCQILRKDKSELLGRRSYEAMAGGEENSRLIIEKSELRRKGISDQYELHLTHENGDDLWLLVAGSPYVDGNGDTIGTIAILTDITTRKITEIKLQEKNNELDAFVYRASHDLKGPLTSIIGVSNIARDEVSDPAALRYFDMIAKSTERLDLTLSELIEATRVNNATIKLEPLNLREMLKEIIGSLQHLPKSKKIQFKTDVKLTNGFVSDRKLLSSILQNLIVNSISYHNTDHENPYVKVTVSEDTEKVQFTVADNGQGIPERLQKKVFEMFYRGNTQSKGTGLGLYIVKNSVERLEGNCELDSVPGRGTRISFTLPQHATH